MQDKKDFNSTNGSKGKTQELIQKKNPPGAWMSVSCVMCCQVEVSATSWTLVQRSSTECGVSKKCVIVKLRKMRRPRPPRGYRAIGEKKNIR
jgi:hypothetical protein